MSLLAGSELTIVGRIMPASNHTYLCELEDGTRCVYKPRSGERPLWDFADGTLALREYAARLVSEQTGWDVVPPTLLRDGPLGPGMVQQWIEADDDLAPVDLVPCGQVPTGYLRVLDAVGREDELVSLVHEDTPALRRMAVFDVLTNNTDRKAGHVLATADGHRWGVDHGVCFHTENKLRTVLWGWSGQALTEEETEGVEAVLTGLEGRLGDDLGELLSRPELRALRQRGRRLLSSGHLPASDGDWPSIPWPPF